MYRDGEEGHIGVRVRTDMEFNNRRNVFAHDESLKLSSAMMIVLSKLFLRVFSASASEMAATDSVDSGCGLAYRHLGFAL